MRMRNRRRLNREKFMLKVACPFQFTFGLLLLYVATSVEDVFVLTLALTIAGAVLMLNAALWYPGGGRRSRR